MGHVDFGPKHHGSFWMLAFTHLMEQCQALLHRPVPERARFAWLGWRSLLGGNVLSWLGIHVGMPLSNQLDRVTKQSLEMV